MPRKLLLCVLLGIATAIAVAWGCALLIDPSHGQMVCSLRTGGTSAWSYWIFQTPGSILVHRIAVSDWRYGGISGPVDATIRKSLAQIDPKLPAWSAVNTAPSPDDFSSIKTRVEDARGWPLVCLLSQRTFTQAASSAAGADEHVDSGFMISRKPFSRWGPLNASRSVVLPIAPLWSGFVIDATIFSSMWCVVLLVPGAVRSAARSRRGACPDCGYDLRYTPDSAVCPECGVSRRAR